MRFDKNWWKTAGVNSTVLLRVGLGCMFLWSALPKIRQPYDFLGNVYDYELVGPKLGMLAAMAIPWLELLLGVCLVGGIFLSGALLTSLGLMAFFTFVHASVLYRGLAISCGCFRASSQEMISYWSLTRNTILLFLCLLLFLVSYYGIARQKERVIA